MQPIDDGGPAFPVRGDELNTGMSLRDYFAGQAMAALVSIPDNDAEPRAHALAAVMHADALLKALKGE